MMIDERLGTAIEALPPIYIEAWKRDASEAEILAALQIAYVMGQLVGEKFNGQDSLAEIVQRVCNGVAMLGGLMVQQSMSMAEASQQFLLFAKTWEEE